MPIKGQAKTDYQREYMRRRRAGDKTAKPQPQAEAKSSGAAQDKADAKIAALERELAQAKQRIEQLRSKTADDVVDLTDAPKTWRQKFETAERRRQREFDWRVQQRAGEIWRQSIAKYLSELEAREKRYNAIINKHKGIMPRATYLKIVKCLHTDTARHVTDQQLNEALIALKEREHVLISTEKPMPEMRWPSTAAEWDELKRKATEARKAKRAAAKAARAAKAETD